jgi:hypothetical protein
LIVPIEETSDGFGVPFPPFNEPLIVVGSPLSPPALGALNGAAIVSPEPFEALLKGASKVQRTPLVTYAPGEVGEFFFAVAMLTPLEPN